MTAIQAFQSTLCLRRLIGELTKSNSHPYFPPPCHQRPHILTNRSAIKVATHTGKTRRRKNVGLKSCHMHHHIQQNNINLMNIPGTNNPAYEITKALPTHIFTTYMSSTMEKETKQHGNNITPQNIPNSVINRSPQSVTPLPPQT